ncbi:unnamed protein product [Microthlaspi erraticum]|uniref:NYN domain-containing protein n=1 Tax=Microthlaspi erraticum TaxID=1685480 RepID=A0A6D2HV16_9BRAS|nr:unnamed protein product [Microthlaspi erraticum]
MASGYRFHANRVGEDDNATAVWWDINRCPVPRDCNPSDVRPKIESALNKLCGPGPVTIFAMGDLHLIPREELEALSNSQILLKQTESGLDEIFIDFHVWAKDHPPPSRMMLISGPGVSIHSFIPSFERDGYTFIRCYPYKHAPFLWENIMGSSLPGTLEVDDETNTHQTCVWWDIDSCLVPKDCNPSSIRGRIRTALDNMSVNGPLNIYCMGDMRNIPRKIKTAISSSGVSMIHHDFGIHQIYSQLHRWTMDNPPPATMMLISNEEVTFHENLYEFEARGYRIIRSYPTHDKSSQGIRWESIVKEREAIMMGREREKKKKEEEETGEPSLYCEAPWYCSLCEFSSDDYISFSKHLDSKDHRIAVRGSFPITDMNDLEDLKDLTLKDPEGPDGGEQG